ncbi:MAG: glycosyltransferase family 4 protein [Rhodospirillales bacterium]|nr:glycosyltransferase family 4 protein [Rhodospirillales bacterium]
MKPSGSAAAPTPRIAVASSGLGHVRRGIESWALDLAAALGRAGQQVSLFGGRAQPGVTALSCLPRDATAARRVAGAFRHLGGWRYGLGAPYEVEQTSFAWSLWRRVRSGYDILHLQDPLVAAWLARAHRRGLSRPRVILAHATGEKPAFLRRFANLQMLTPLQAADWQVHRAPAQKVFAVANFVDTAQFAPGDRDAARREFDLPPATTIFLCCAAIRRFHKRIDWLLQEFARAQRELAAPALLVVAGGREEETEELVAMGRALLGGGVRFLVGVPRERMPLLYQAADVFVLPSLWEMFSIALLEAMATGLPVICHDTPAFRFAAGPAALYRDLERPGTLAAGVLELAAAGPRRALAAAARRHVEANFSEPVVVAQILAMYRSVLESR